MNAVATRPAMNNQTQLSRLDAIEGKIDRNTAGAIAVSADGGMEVKTMGQAMEFAKLMAVSDKAVPSHLRGNVGACLAVTMRGMEWGINPFAIANKTYVVNDRLAFESALYQAVLTRRAPIKGRLKSEYIGQGPKRQCRVYAELVDGEKVEYTSPETGNIKPKNSPLWQNDPDQQLYYFSVRSFARRHFEDVMMGVYTVDEMHDSRDAKIATTAVSRNAALESQLTSRPVSEGQILEPADDAGEQLNAQQADDIPAEQPAEQPAPETPEQENARQEIADALDQDWEGARRVLIDAGAKATDPAAAAKGVDAWAKLHAPKGDREKIPTEKRQELYAAIVEGRFDFGAAKIVAG